MSVHAPGTRWYNAVWRWHFYAGLLCVPFVLWLSITGSIYLWRPQIEALLDRPYDHLAMTGPRLAAHRQVEVALAAVTDARLVKYVLPERPDQAVRVLVQAGGEQIRVYVDPYRGTVLHQVPEEQRLMRWVFHLHGELMAGNVGSALVELAACWAVVMLITGLYLWWPRGRRGLAGVLYPRFQRGRVLWRDLHAVSGVWVSLLALALILTGLPWANVWGNYFKQVRIATHSLDGPLDWTIGSHTAHMAMGGMASPATSDSEIDAVVAAASTLTLAPPVLVAPPAMPGMPWTASSDAADRPLRATVKLDADGQVRSRQDFAQRHWIDRVVGYGIAAHEGALFGLANQLLGTITALLLALLSVSGVVLWWRRRPTGRLGAPLPLTRPRFRAWLVGLIGFLGILMPLFGISLLVVLAVEHVLLRHLPAFRSWLGLKAA
jgi:uncharacterized iron-regulated membrane protein